MESPRELIVITGVSRGLGHALARWFQRNGRTVAGCARSRQAVTQLQTDCPPPCMFAAVDVSDDRAVAAWADEVLSRHGAPALLINNAAIINRNAPLWRVPAQEFDELMRVNVTGTANVIRHFLPAMIARGRGVVVNLSSGWGRSTDAEVAPYCASKWAIEGLTQSLAQELPDGLAAVAVNPGIIDTEMLRSCFGGNAASYPSPEAWAERAAPWLLRLGPRDNGRPLTVP